MNGTWKTTRMGLVALVLGCLLAASLGFNISAGVQSRRVERDIGELIAESRTAGESLTAALGTLTDVQATIGVLTVGVGNLADANHRALGTSRVIGELSGEYEAGATDLIELSDELAAEIERALERLSIPPADTPEGDD